MAAPLLEVIGLGRAFQDADVSGDAWLHLPQEWGSRIALVDGAGHGPTAAVAATAALGSVRATVHQSLGDALTRCHVALNGTRGAVMTLIDITETSITIAGVGNVDAQLVSRERSVHFTPDRGLLGSTMPKVRPVTFAQPDGEWYLVMYSDGISSRMKPAWAPLATLEARNAYLEAAMTEWRRLTDDSTLVLITPIAAESD